MSSPRDGHYYESLGKSRRSPPADNTQGSGFFQTGQGGRTVLPPLSSAFPTSRFPVPSNYSNQYTQPRSSPGRIDYNNPALYYPPNSAAPQASSFPYYETHDSRYSLQSTYPSYPPRVSPTPMQGDPHDPRKRSPHREERWPSPAYTHGSTHIPSSSPRSPTVSYPNPSYPTPYYPPTGHSGQYQYASVPVPDSRTHHHSSQPIPHSHASSLDRMVTSRNEIREPSPYSGASSASPISPNSADEPVLKKKRKRADAAQLKVLNDTYQRTAFPSTEERNELARMLDMSARSVQIWFQNKRQSMRQTNRQASSSTSHQPFAVPSQSDPMEDMGHSSLSAYGTSTISIGSPSYIPRSHESSRSPIPQSSSIPRVRGREESADPRKWSSSRGTGY